MDEDSQYEFEHLQCLMLKAQIVSQMTANVKSKIALSGYTPGEIATAYILKIYRSLDSDATLIDAYRTILEFTPDTAAYDHLVYDETGTFIVDIFF